jgi:hypothetical protein
MGSRRRRTTRGLAGGRALSRRLLPLHDLREPHTAGAVGRRRSGPMREALPRVPFRVRGLAQSCRTTDPLSLSHAPARLRRFGAVLETPVRPQKPLSARKASLRAASCFIDSAGITPRPPSGEGERKRGHSERQVRGLAALALGGKAQRGSEAWSPTATTGTCLGTSCAATCRVALLRFVQTTVGSAHPVPRFANGRSRRARADDLGRHRRSRRSSLRARLVFGKGLRSFPKSPAYQWYRPDGRLASRDIAYVFWEYLMFGFADTGSG